MAVGDQYRRISPADQLVFDSTGALSGIKSGLSGASEGRMLTQAQATAVQALVSEAGTITAAALLTTAGTLGQTVRLSDGTDKGAILMWSTPAGTSTPAWCWWLWPQASYL